jgi:hypothetical protein
VNVYANGIGQGQFLRAPIGTTSCRAARLPSVATPAALPPHLRSRPAAGRPACFRSLDRNQLALGALWNQPAAHSPSPVARSVIQGAAILELRPHLFRHPVIYDPVPQAKILRHLRIWPLAATAGKHQVSHTTSGQRRPMRTAISSAARRIARLMF